MLADDLANRASLLRRHEILLGRDKNGAELTLPSYGVSALVVGTSGGGKSTLTTGLIERLTAKRYGFCVIDPEGDYDVLEDAAVLGGADRAPSVDECMQLLAKPNQNVVINLVGLQFSDRPAFFMTFFARIRDLRAKTGHPHWLIVDEVHHVLPADWKPAELNLPRELDGVLMISVGPSAVSATAVGLVETVIVIGEKPAEMLREFAETNGKPVPQSPLDKIPKGEAVIWHKASSRAAATFCHRALARLSGDGTCASMRKVRCPKTGRSTSAVLTRSSISVRRTSSCLLIWRTAWMPDTWLYHWRRGEVSGWLRRCVKDEELTNQVEALEKQVPDDADASRKAVREIIERKYTLPAEQTRRH